MYGGYLYFNGVEIASNERVLAYLRGNMEYGFAGLRHANTSVSANCGCATARPLYCDQGSGLAGEYISPALDDAPWYDPDVPESAEFAGLFIEDIEGFDSVVSRDFEAGAISGSSLGPLKLGGRCLTYTGWLRAKTCCAAEYGLRWLQEALLGDPSCNNCSVGDLYMLKCCPPDTDTCHLDDVATYNDFVRALGLEITVTDTGSGTYEIIFDDYDQNYVVSDPDGAANNVLGFLPVVLGNSNGWRLGFTEVEGANATIVFNMPYDVVTGTSTSSSGTGASITINVDTTVTSDCEDTQAVLDEFATFMADFITEFGDGVPSEWYVAGDGFEYDEVAGIDPHDYIRLMHRVGLTDGPKVIERAGTCCAECGCVNIKVQFTLCSELPYIFSDIEYCVEEFPFDKEHTYCLDLRSICGSCSDSVGTKMVERAVTRPTCGIVLRHDYSWCADGWDIQDGCPPEDCIMEITQYEEYTPPDDGGCTSASSGTDTCNVFLTNYGLWVEDGWDVADGFPPDFCNLTIDGGGECDTEADEEPCLVRLIYSEITGLKTWEAIRWTAAVPFPGSCACVEIAEICYIERDTTECIIPTECPITVNCFGAWTPDGWTHDPTAPFPDPNCTYTISNEQDTSPLIELVEVPGDEFIPDCGPFPVQPPTPFTIDTSCYCEPWETYRTCCTFRNPGDWNDATSYIEIYSGSSELRRLKIEAYQNPFGDAVPCPCDPLDDFWACREACATILVPQLPPNTKVIVDSRTRIAQMVLSSGRVVNAMRYLLSADGNPFEWMDISQCSTFCVVVSVDSQFVADDAWVSMGAVNRYLASGW